MFKIELTMKKESLRREEIFIDIGKTCCMRLAPASELSGYNQDDTV